MMFRLSGRARKILVGVVLACVVLGAVFLAVLPEIVRRVAVSQASKLTGRTVSLDDVDLNVFTGHLALKDLHVAKRGVNERAFEVERLDVRVDYLPLFRRDVRVTELSVAGMSVNLLRRGPVEFDFSDILDNLRGADAPAQTSKSAESTSSPWTVTLSRVSVRRLTVNARDLTTSPESTWRLDEMTLDASGLTTRRDAQPGRLETSMKLNGAPISMKSDALVLQPLAVAGWVTVDGFDLAHARPYVPPTVPAAPHAGRASLAMALAIELAPQGLKRGTVKGDVTLDGLEVFQAGRGEPFFKVSRLGVKIKEADLVAHSAVIAAVELEAPSVRAVRDAQKKIDLLALAERPAAAKGDAPKAGTAPTGNPPAPAQESTPAAPAAGAPAPEFKLKVEQVALRNGGATFRDEAVKPVNTLAITNLTADIKDVSWPSEGPAAFVISMTMPKSGRVEMKGSATPQPLDVDFNVSLRDGSIDPYQPYIPVKARFAGVFHGENRNHITLDNGVLTATSRGWNQIDKFAILAPGQKTPTAGFQHLRLDGIDFSWPKYAKVSKITLTKPDVRVEREADGAISLRKLFEPDPAKVDALKPEAARQEPEKAEPPQKEAAPRTSPDGQPAGPIPIPVEIGMFVLEDGYAQFVDRTTTPPFTESLSRLAVTIEGLSTTPGRRARVTTQAVIGGNSAFDLKGEIAPFGEVYADLAGELRDFKLTSVNPYADPLIAWAMKTGQLAVKVHYRIEKNQLTAENEVIVRNLTVAPTRQNDEVKKKIGLPLGMIVALITDADNGIHVNVPLSGELNQVKAGMGDAIWTAVKNALTNIVSAPFRSINKLFKGKSESLDDLQVDAVTFAPGSADVSPEMAKHLTEVGGFLKKAPMIKFALAPVPAPRDAESLKAQEVVLKIQRLQKERGIADHRAAIAVAFKEQLPDVKPPESDEERLTALREREEVSDARMAELLQRRVAAVRNALTTSEGIAAERLLDGPAQPPASDESAEGRIEFQIEQ
jgi:uncharacterized protein involved in outer membrane biogenesis